MADGQIELADETTRAEGGQRFAKLEQLRFGGRRGFLGLLMTGAGTWKQAGKALLLETAQPLADRGHGGSEESRGGLDPVLASAFDQPQAMVVRVFHFTNQNEVGGGHSRRIVSLADRRGGRLWKRRRLGRLGNRCANSHFPTATPAMRLISSSSPPPAPVAASGLHTSAPLRGYDVSRLFQAGFVLDNPLIHVHLYWFYSTKFRPFYNGERRRNGCLIP